MYGGKLQSESLSKVLKWSNWEVLYEMLLVPRVYLSFWFSSGVRVAMGEIAKRTVFESVKVFRLGEVSLEMFSFGLPHVFLSFWFSSGVGVSMAQTENRIGFEGVKEFKLEEVLHKMLVLTLPHVSS